MNLLAMDIALSLVWICGGARCEERSSPLARVLHCRLRKLSSTYLALALAPQMFDLIVGAATPLLQRAPTHSGKLEKLDFGIWPCGGVLKSRAPTQSGKRNLSCFRVALVLVIAAATAKSTGVYFGTDVTIAALCLVTRGTWTIWVVDSSFIRVARRPCLEDVPRCLKV